MTKPTAQALRAGPTVEQVVAGVQRSVDGVLTTINGTARVNEQDLMSAIETGVALAFAGLVVVEGRKQ